MRVWDISPGYLNRGSLLGEHRELHAIVSIIVNNKRGYANHPETRRWVGYGWALKKRHRLLAAEMALRGYTDRSPVGISDNQGGWPEIYIDEPSVQFARLKEKYLNKEPGRIPLPLNSQQLWSHHKYSVLARSQSLYREIGRSVAGGKSDDFPELARGLIELLRTPPSEGGLRNSLHHMWGHVSDMRPEVKGSVETWSFARLLGEIQRLVLVCKEPYLSSSTALSEFMAWIPKK